MGVLIQDRVRIILRMPIWGLTTLSLGVSSEVAKCHLDPDRQCESAIQISKISLNLK